MLTYPDDEDLKPLNSTPAHDIAQEQQVPRNGAVQTFPWTYVDLSQP